jgi:hypothetical protein
VLIDPTSAPQISRLSKLVVIAERFEDGIFESAGDGLPVDLVSRGEGGSSDGLFGNGYRLIQKTRTVNGRIEQNLGPGFFGTFREATQSRGKDTRR